MKINNNITNNYNNIENPCKTAVAYYRVSSVSQRENTSLDSQRDHIMDYARRNNINIVAEFKDVASGGNINRDGFKQVMEFIKNNPADIFMVWKYDRAHRNLKETLIFVDELKKINVDYISVHQNIDTSTSQGKLFFQMVCSFAEFEKEVIRERCKDGRVAKINKKEAPGCRPPVGYDKEWNIVEDKAKIVKDIFNAYLRLDSLKKLKEYCKDNGYNELIDMTLGKSSLSMILRNRVYLGEFAYDGNAEKHGVLWKEHHKVIISKNIFGRVQKLLLNNNKK